MNSRGFTMTELLISVGIFSLMITGMTIALVQQQRQFKFTQDAIELDHTARATLDYMASQIRNAASRQGKTFSLEFFNGGSGVNPPCSDNTLGSGTVNSPPDCLTVYTWDITKGQFQEDDPLNPGVKITKLPSVSGTVAISSLGPPLILDLPPGWFADEDGNDFNPPLIESGDLIGFISRFRICNPEGLPFGSVDCVANPEQCTECASIIRVDIDDQNRAVIDSVSDIIEENSEEDFTDLSVFTTNFFVPAFSSVVSEITIVDSKTFRVDLNQKELEISQGFDVNGEPTNFQPIAGGLDAPGIVDIQLVFNIQGLDGVITKVGVPSDTTNRMFADFAELDAEDDPTLGTLQDIRSVEIYVVVRSQTRPQKIFGAFFSQDIPAIADVAQKSVADGLVDPEEGFIYRVFSTTVYVRNMAREEFG